MTLEQFATACHATLGLLSRPAKLTAARCPSDPTNPEHLAWMLVQATMFYADDRQGKANRWLGFVQGVMSALGYATLDELKAANMPGGAAFDGDRI